MTESTVLLMSRDPSLVGWVDSEVGRVDELRLDAVDEIEAACSRATCGGVGMIVVQLGKDVGAAEVARLLWASSTLRRPVPVVAISERYQVDRAVMLFQLGVADYLSRSHHRNRLRDVIETLALHPSDRPASRVEAGHECGLVSGLA